MRKTIVTLVAVVAFSGAAIANSPEHAHHPAAATDVYAVAMKKMHTDMKIEPTGDADIDFARGMIPHHQGAIDMALILKEKGRDPELQKLADDIIAAQEKEIAFLNNWLAQHDKK
jgi:uncharacterized protein (DUF305 family)